MTAEDQPATERVRLIVASEIERLGPIGYGTDWWELTPEEEAVFQIRLEDMRTLVTIWNAYEEFNRVVHVIGINRKLIDDMKKEHSWAMQMRRRYPNAQDFQRFAKLFGVSYRLSYAWFHKNLMWGIRDGLTYFHDEPLNAAQMAESIR